MSGVLCGNMPQPTEGTILRAVKMGLLTVDKVHAILAVETVSDLLQVLVAVEAALVRRAREVLFPRLRSEIVPCRCVELVRVVVGLARGLIHQAERRRHVLRARGVKCGLCCLETAHTGQFPGAMPALASPPNSCFCGPRRPSRDSNFSEAVRIRQFLGVGSRCAVRPFPTV